MFLLPWKPRYPSKTVASLYRKYRKILKSDSCENCRGYPQIDVLQLVRSDFGYYVSLFININFQVGLLFFTAILHILEIWTTITEKRINLPKKWVDTLQCMYLRRHVSNFIVIRPMDFGKYSVQIRYPSQNEEMEKKQNKDSECLSLAMESKIFIESTFLFICLCDCNSSLHKPMTYIGINSLITVTQTATIINRFIPHSHIWIYSWKILATKSSNAAV